MLIDKLPDPPIYLKFTRSEIRIIKLVSLGFNNPQIAEIMHIQRDSVRSHLFHVYRKISCNNRICLSIKYRTGNWNCKHDMEKWSC